MARQNRGAYAAKFARVLAPEKRLAFLTLQYGQLCEGDRDLVRNSFLRSGSPGVFVGRMPLLKGCIRSYGLPQEAYHIDDLIRSNTIFIFGAPCCQWWFKAMKTVGDLVRDQRGNVTVDKFFLGYNEFPVRFLDEIIEGDCNVPEHPPRDTSYAESVDGNSMFRFKMYLVVSELKYGGCTCLMFEIHRSIQDFLAKGRHDFVCREINFAFVCREINFAFAELFQLLVAETGGCSCEEMLGTLLEIWRDLAPFFERSKQFFAAMEPWSVVEVGYNKWRNNVLNSPDVELTNKLLELIMNGRSGLLIDCTLLKSVNEMLMEIGEEFYIEKFETPYLENTSEYYKEESKRLSVKLEGVRHFKELYSLIAADAEHASSYIVGQTGEHLMELSQDILLGRMFRWLSEYLLRFADGNTDPCADLKELSMIFDFLDNTPGGRSFILPGVMNCFDAPTASSLFKGHPEDVEPILTYMDHCKTVIRCVFNDDSELLQAFNNSIFTVLNSHKSTPKAIAMCVDKIIRKASHGGSTQEAKRVIIAFMPLLKEHWKKEFDDFLREYQAKRVLSEQGDMEFERMLLSDLEGSCSYGLITKSRLFLDHSEESVTKFQDFEDTSAGHGSLLSVKVFDPKSWISKPRSSKLTPELKEVSDLFKTYYLQHEISPVPISARCQDDSYTVMAGRKLIWETDAGTAIVIGHFEGGKCYEFKVTTYQMCILSLLDSSSALSFDDIRSSTGIEKTDLKGALDTLCSINVLVTKKSDKGEVFCVNPEFTYASDKVDLCESSAAEEDMSTRPETKSMKPIPSLKTAIDIALLKLVKVRKSILHDDLITDVLKQLKEQYSLQISDIEMRINLLIEEEFIIRDKGDPFLYHHVD